MDMGPVIVWEGGRMVVSIDMLSVCMELHAMGNILDRDGR